MNGISHQGLVQKEKIFQSHHHMTRTLSCRGKPAIPQPITRHVARVQKFYLKDGVHYLCLYDIMTRSVRNWFENAPDQDRTARLLPQNRTVTTPRRHCHVNFWCQIRMKFHDQSRSVPRQLVIARRTDPYFQCINPNLKPSDRRNGINRFQVNMRTLGNK